MAVAHEVVTWMSYVVDEVLWLTSCLVDEVWWLMRCLVVTLDALCLEVDVYLLYWTIQASLLHDPRLLWSKKEVELGSSPRLL